MSMCVFIGINVVLHRISNYPLQTRHYDPNNPLEVGIWRSFRMCIVYCVCVRVTAERTTKTNFHSGWR